VLSELVDGAGAAAGAGAIRGEPERALGTPHLPATGGPGRPVPQAGARAQMATSTPWLTPQPGGYERLANVEQRNGQARAPRRIVDVFPVSAELPVAWQFFGDHAEKLREFDLAASARSIVETVRSPPPGMGRPVGGFALRGLDADGLDALLSPESPPTVAPKADPRDPRRLEWGWRWAANRPRCWITCPRTP